MPGSERAVREPDAGRRQVRCAWIAVALIPVAFVVAMVAGEGLIDALGYPSGGDKDPPLWAKLVVGGPFTLLMIAPALAAFVCGRRARASGAGRPAFVAMLIGAIVAAYIVLTFIAGVAGAA
ncbi:MAG: hypothetical protein AB7T37_18915 [Dehalococcoidia bacterium]